MTGGGGINTRGREGMGKIRKNLLKQTVGRSGGRGNCCQQVVHERGINIKN